MCENELASMRYMYASEIMFAETPMYPESVRQLAIALYESGLSCRATSSRLNRELGIVVTPQAIARWARELGLNRPVGDRRSVRLPNEAVRLYESGMGGYEEGAEVNHLSFGLLVLGPTSNLMNNPKL